VATIEQFARITRTVIADVGFDDFLPKALHVARKAIVAIEGVPTNPSRGSGRWEKRSATKSSSLLWDD